MKRFSRKSFSQIMISKKLKKELDQLKQKIATQTHAYFALSYNDVISHLVKLYNSKQNTTMEASFENPGLNVSIPLSKVTTNYVTELDQDDWIVKSSSV